MASSTNQPLAVPVPVTPIGTIASTSYSPTFGVELRQDYTELMPAISNQTTNLCSTLDISPKVFVLNNSVTTYCPIIITLYVYVSI